MQNCPLEITVIEASALLKADPQHKNVLLIDVREPHEIAIACLADAQKIPMRQIPENMPALLAAAREGKHLLIHCHHGGRSMRVTEFLRANGIANVSNVAGGIDAWAEHIDPSLARY